MKKVIFIFLLLLAGCGYKSIYVIGNQLNKEFNKIITNGDQRINSQIINNIKIKENSINEKKLILDTNFLVEETSKNSKGQAETYRSIIDVEITVTENNKTIKKQRFINQFSYNNRDNKFELIKYQNEIKDELVKKTSEEIILFLNLL